MAAVPGEVKARFGAAGAIVALVSFAVGWSFGRHGRSRR
jgi:hypothetical protein